jgi:hypothetical protein
MGDTPALHLTITAFRALLGATDDMDTDFGENIEQIFKSTSEFSMNLCRINLRLVLEYSQLSNIVVGEKSGELVERIIASVVGQQGQSGKSGDLVKSLNAESKQLVLSAREYQTDCSFVIIWKSRSWMQHRYREVVFRTDPFPRSGAARK